MKYDYATIRAIREFAKTHSYSEIGKAFFAGSWSRAYHFCGWHKIRVATKKERVAEYAQNHTVTEIADEFFRGNLSTARGFLQRNKIDYIKRHGFFPRTENLYGFSVAELKDKVEDEKWQSAMSELFAERVADFMLGCANG